MPNAIGQLYEPLQSAGHLPADFTLSPIQKYEQLVDGISSQARKSGRAIEEQFYLKSSFVIDELLKSGKVLFNDPVTEYINEVATELLLDDPALRKELRFYAVRSSAVNAFATHEGIIFINLGLIARLETEAQLAFILAHEITHYKEKHAFNLYANDVRNSDAANRSVFGDKALEANLLSKKQFSHHLELEADEKGLMLFANSKYSIENITKVFEVLAFSHQTFGDENFNINFFATNNLRFPQRLHLDAIRQLPSKYYFGESQSHPNLKQREVAVQKQLTELSNPNISRKTFIVGEPLFFRLREKVRFELSYLYLQEGNYYNSIYNSYLLLENGYESIYLEKCIAKALQGLIYFRNAKRTNKVEIHHDYVGGHIQRLHYFINTLKNDELNVLALTYAWQLYKKDTNDEEVKNIVKGLFQQLVNYHYDSIDAFYENAPQFDGAMMTMTEKSVSVPSNSWEKEFQKYAFVDYLADPTFLNFFSESKRKKFIQKQKLAFADTEYGKSIQRNRSKKELEQGMSLGIDRVVIINPHYVKYDSRKINNEQKLFIESETARQDFRKKLWKNAQRTSLQLSILDIKQLKSTDINKYNDLVSVNEWFNQQLEFDQFDMPSFNQAEMDKIAKKYGTDYFVWMGMVNRREKKDILSSLSEFYTPYNGFYNLLTPKYESMFFAVVYDVKHYDLKMVKMEFINLRDHSAVINTHIYDTFLQIKRKGY